MSQFEPQDLNINTLNNKVYSHRGKKIRLNLFTPKM